MTMKVAPWSWNAVCRILFLASVLTTLMLLAVGPTQAAGAVSAVTAPSVSKSQEPAKPAAPTIIPGSPLAALTGADTPPHVPSTSGAPVNAKAPFGTQTIGFALSAVLGRGTEQTINDFIGALKHSTRLGPIVQWGHEVARSSRRWADVWAILRGIGTVIVPGLILDILVAFLLRRPAHFWAMRAMPREREYLQAPGSANGQPQFPLRLSMRGWFRRCGNAGIRFLLMLLPLVAFVVFVMLVLSTGMIANRPALLAVTGITNAYICARLVQDVLRLLLAPKTPTLRLIRIPTPYAKWAMRRATILIVTLAVGFCLISGAEILGLSDSGATSAIRLLGLVVHLELAVWVWQSRKVVGRWIAGKGDAKGIVSGLRQRFAKVWYIFALFYLIGLWLAWAGGVHNALGAILRAVLVIFAVLVLARLAWVGCNKLARRLFPDGEEGGKGATFRKRFKSYNPLVRALAQVFIVVLALVLVLQGWGVDAFGWILVNPIGRALLSTILNLLFTIIGATLVWEICNYLLERQINYLNAAGRTRQVTRLRTLTPMIRAALAVVVVMLALIIGLSRIGVNTTGLLAVSSVVGIAVGFGSQKLVQDVITGLFLLFEDAVQVGDSVTLGGVSGTVERLSIRTIRLRGGDGSVNIVPFSSVSIVTNQTRDFSFAQLSVMIGYKENVDEVVALLKEIGAQMRGEPGWEMMIRDDVQIFGLDSFGELGLVITGQVRTVPGQQAAVRREFQGRVQKRFLEVGIDLPYRHQTLQLEVPPGEIKVVCQNPTGPEKPENG